MTICEGVSIGVIRKIAAFTCFVWSTVTATRFLVRFGLKLSVVSLFVSWVVMLCCWWFLLTIGWGVIFMQVVIVLSLLVLFLVLLFYLLLFSHHHHLSLKEKNRPPWFTSTLSNPLSPLTLTLFLMFIYLYPWVLTFMDSTPTFPLI